MRRTILGMIFVAAGIVILLNNAGIATACPEDLECANFTAQDKIQDCNYVTNEDLSESQEQQVLCVLWEQPYYFEPYQPQEYELDADLSMDYNEIDNSRFILAGKIFILGLLNYIMFSLTKSSVILKWLSAV